MFLAGHETTTSLITSTLILLEQNPAARAELAAEPDRLPMALEEVLRFESAVQFTSRCAIEDVVLDGVTVAKDVTVLLLLGAANRDPTRFVDLDRFDIHRSPNPYDGA